MEKLKVRDIIRKSKVYFTWIISFVFVGKEFRNHVYSNAIPYKKTLTKSIITIEQKDNLWPFLCMYLSIEYRVKRITCLYIYNLHIHFVDLNHCLSNEKWHETLYFSR